MAQLNLVVSQADFERASWLAMRKGPLPRALRFYFRLGFAALWVLMCLTPFVAHRNIRDLRDGLIFGSIGPALLALQLYLVKLGFGREYRRSAALRLPATVDLDDTGLHWVTTESDSRSNWRIFLKYSEDRSSFVLFHRGSLAFVPIPKRTLSPLQIEELHVIFESHLARK